MATVQVTQEIIDDSVARDSSHCMIAEAIKASLPDAKNVSVDLATIRFSRGDRRYIHLTPRTAQEALVRFDQGEAPQPFRINLSKPAQIHEARTRRSDQRAKVVAGEPKPHGRAAPTVVGGQSPPAAALPGKIRRFGLKGLRA